MHCVSFTSLHSAFPKTSPSSHGRERRMMSTNYTEEERRVMRRISEEEEEEEGRTRTHTFARGVKGTLAPAMIPISPGRWSHLWAGKIGYSVTVLRVLPGRWSHQILWSHLWAGKIGYSGGSPLKKCTSKTAGKTTSKKTSWKKGHFQSDWSFAK